MKVLVTGGCGFVGGHLVEALHKAGHAVHALTRSGVKSGAMANGITMWSGDVSLRGDICRVLDAVQPECVFHLAAQQPMGGTFERFQKTNAVGSLMLLSACESRGIRKVIAGSTMAVFGAGKGNAVTEESPVDPTTEYAMSKLMGELCMRMVAERGGPRVMILRYPGIYGPRVKETMVKYLFDCVRGGKRAEIRNSNMIMDYVSVHDVVRANLLALQSESGAACDVIHIGGGVDGTREQLVARVASVCGGLEWSADGEPVSGGGGLRVNLAKAKSLIGYIPTGLDANLREYWDWYQRN